MSRRAFITGATGFVGFNLVLELLDQGWKVTALHRQDSDTRRLEALGDVELAGGSLWDAESLERAIPREVDAVFHVAGDTSLWRGHRDRQRRTNVTGTANLVKASLRRKVGRFIHTSSIAAYGLHDGRIRETTLSNAASSGIDYMKTKYEAERVVLFAWEQGLDAVVLQPAHIVGPWDETGWSRTFRLVLDDELPGIPPGRGSWCHVREVARCHLSAFERGRGGERYLLGGPSASFVEVFGIIGELTGRKVPTRPVPAFALRAWARLLDLRSRITGQEPSITPAAVAIVSANETCDATKAREELGYREIPVRTMFEDCWNWLKSSLEPEVRREQ